MYFKVKPGEMPGVWPLCSLWSYLCLMMSSDSRVFGRVSTHTHAQTIIQLFAPLPALS